MFGLFYGLWQWLFEKKKFNFLIIGLDDSGKSTIFESIKAAYHMKSLSYDLIVPTVGFNITTIDINGIEAVLWDIGGDIKIRNIWESYYMDAHGVIFVIDSSNTYRFDEVKSVFRAEVIQNTSLKLNCPILIFANKQDINTSVSIDEINKLIDINILENERNGEVRVQGCVGIERVGVVEGLKWVVDAANTAYIHTHTHTHTSSTYTHT
eukprot:GHVR01085546.1.p1 GENE.GHVR01085546.1~~GHVR01085546.1.p1  ORF type:complete len:209 (-),score=64.35 GHVR01085546.1:165-791(-)